MEPDNNTKTREEIFTLKAAAYNVCYATACPLSRHCLRHILAGYVAADRLYVRSVNLSNPATQRDGCPMYRIDEPLRMPVGLAAVYHDMPSHIERAVKRQLIGAFSRKTYYEYHNGKRPMTPDVEEYVRQTLQAHGWTQEPAFAGYTDDYQW